MRRISLIVGLQLLCVLSLAETLKADIVKNDGNSLTNDDRDTIIVRLPRATNIPALCSGLFVELKETIKKLSKGKTAGELREAWKKLSKEEKENAVQNLVHGVRQNAASILSELVQAALDSDCKSDVDKLIKDGVKSNVSEVLKEILLVPTDVLLKEGEDLWECTKKYIRKNCVMLDKLISSIKLEK